jgi:hypothetical protein
MRTTQKNNIRQMRRRLQTRKGIMIGNTPRASHVTESNKNVNMSSKSITVKSNSEHAVNLNTNSNTNSNTNLSVKSNTQSGVSTEDINVSVSKKLSGVTSTISGSAVKSLSPLKKQSRKKIALCCANSVPNVLKYTNKAIKANVIDPLRIKYDVDQLILNSTQETIESRMFLNAKIINMAKSEINDATASLVKHSLKPEFQKSVIEMYMEKKMYALIKESEKKNDVKYDVVVFIKSDIFPAKQIQISEISDVINNNNSVYCCNFNDWNGYGVGYYIGTPDAMNIILRRFDNVTSDRTSSEKLLKLAIDDAKLMRCSANMFHFKVNSTGGADVYYQLLKKYTSNQEYMNTIKQYQSVTNTSKKKIAEKSLDDLSISTKSNKSKSAQRRKQKRRSCPN